MTNKEKLVNYSKEIVSTSTNLPGNGAHVLESVPRMKNLPIFLVLNVHLIFICMHIIWVLSVLLGRSATILLNELEVEI